MSKNKHKSRSKAEKDGELPDSAYTLDHKELPDKIKALAFPSSDHAYSERLDRKVYEKQLLDLQIELVKLQSWLQDKNERVVVVFEGRDAAGKGGTIQRIRQYLNPRFVRHVALAKPSDVERGQWYFQRYADHLPTHGEMVLYDRSWYNRGGVERVMGFCNEEQVDRFFRQAPVFETMLQRDGIYLFKFWLDVGRAEQLKRFYDRKTNPLKQWKLSTMDQKSIAKWHDYTKAIADIFRHTDTAHAPWMVVDSNDKRRARLECIKFILNDIDYKGRDPKAIGETDKRLVETGQAYLDRTEA